MWIFLPIHIPKSKSLFVWNDCCSHFPILWYLAVPKTKLQLFLLWSTQYLFLLCLFTRNYKLSPDSSSGPWNSLRTFIGLLARFWLPRLTWSSWLFRILVINTQYLAYNMRYSAFTLLDFGHITLALTSSGASLLTSGFFSGAFIFHTTSGGVSCCTWKWKCMMAAMLFLNIWCNVWSQQCYL